MKISAILLLLTGLMFACHSTSSETDDEEIQALAIEQGNMIARSAQALGGQLKKAMTDGGPIYALDFCNSVAHPILDTLSTVLPVDIKRASLRLRNPADAPNDVEREILEDFSERLAAGNKLLPEIKSIGDDQILYAKPILLDNPICLNCHGKIGSQVADETYEKILELYPDDQATGHELNDLRGIWSITFQREDLVSYLRENSTSSK